MEINDIITAIQNGLAVKGSGPRCGCGRAYVCLSSTDRKVLNLFKKSMAACGIRYIGNAYGSGTRAAYIGYDNGTGTPLAQAEAISRNLNALGVSCYDDAVSD